MARLSRSGLEISLNAASTPGGKKNGSKLGPDMRDQSSGRRTAEATGASGPTVVVVLDSGFEGHHAVVPDCQEHIVTRPPDSSR